MKKIKNIDVVTKDGVLENYEVLIKDGIIQKIAYSIEDEGINEIIDGQGGYLVPGFIDIHSDYIEQLAAPRVTSVMDFSLALYEFERELVTHGITTMYHSISFLKETGKKALRKPENVKKMIELIDKSHKQLHLVHHRFHLRLELDNIDVYNDVVNYIKEDKVHLISFMDHTPGQGQYRDLEIYKKSYLNDEGLTEEQVNQKVNDLMTKEKLTLDKIIKIADLAKEKKIPIASHDDDTLEKLEVIKNFHATISEFPITMEVLEEAYKQGFDTVVGAPNILLGGSHAGNLSAKEAIDSGCAKILCSDYYPASLLHAVFMMVDQGQPLHEMINKVSLNAAKAVNIDHEVGSIEVGKKADMLIVMRLPDKYPAITHVFVEGVLVSNMNYRV
ncbi:phosphonate metabolism protein PhnM [Anaerorhabdus furcosa]|uniref:Alpha-D-ribose 1-methylphosphonate 5-triphosphate diphosphatase n=1 Tax=Anaerorhabdus furcosa TaxID=118967 RepID=A0A1T4MSZ7_9FIRM|nr:phosphonate metabolism protein PhnM [Anaerorhabdus furcosa]SJZ70122.1 alpha-D-ribose 1-methylphosphonate 5-triphosphate diphosphatase [Anaerorhabdus furcosa]